MKKFKKIYVEITNTCNLKCSFCPTSERPTKTMDAETFGIIARNIKEHTGLIFLHVKGEPLLHPNLEEILEICADNNLKVNITTNGTLISKIGFDLLSKRCIRQINISLHSFPEQTDFLRANYLQNIIEFAREATQNAGIVVSLRLWNISKSNEAENTVNKIVFETLEQEFNLPYSIELTLKPGNGIRLTDRLFLNSDFRFVWPHLSDTFSQPSGFCFALRDQIAILADGTVVPCCLDGEGAMNLGNILQNNLTEIIDSEKAQAIYNGFTNKTAIEPLCIKCRYKERNSRK